MAADFAGRTGIDLTPADQDCVIDTDRSDNHRWRSGSPATLRLALESSLGAAIFAPGVSHHILHFGSGNSKHLASSYLSTCRYWDPSLVAGISVRPIHEMMDVRFRTRLSRRNTTGYDDDYIQHLDDEAEASGAVLRSYVTHVTHGCAYMSPEDCANAGVYTDLVSMSLIEAQAGIVVASNVLNVQPDIVRLHQSLRYIDSRLQPGGYFIFNIPSSPRRNGLGLADVASIVDTTLPGLARIPSTEFGWETDFDTRTAPPTGVAVYRKAVADGEDST